MASGFRSLFQPGQIGRVEIRNRIVLAPMGTWLTEPDGRYSQREIDYYAERARGGVGLITTGAARVERVLEPVHGFLALVDEDRNIPAMADLAQAVHAFGGRISLQLSAGLGRAATPLVPGVPPVSASAVPSFADPSVICRSLTVEEIQGLVSAFGRAAGRAAEAGFDAVDIHAHVGYLPDQFMSPIWNKRTDQYGGSFEGRMRFPVEIVQAIRKTVGQELAIIFRLSVDHKLPGGRGIEEGQEIAMRLEAAGVDAIHADAGCREAREWVFPPGYLGDECMVDMAAAIKRVVSIPVIAVGNMTPEGGDRAIAEGKADFVASGRGLIADPEWPNKVWRGWREDVRPCVRCNDGCIGRIYAKKTLSCALNPQAGYERIYEVRRAEVKKRVVVVGGGPAGMEAARVAAARGHHVTLLEKECVLGGQLVAATTPDFKRELRRAIEWWETQLRKLGVALRFNVRVTPETPDLAQADAIIVATGARPLLPAIPGINGENVVSVVDYYRGHRVGAGNRIVVAGGGLAGCDTALDLAMKGMSVTIVEMLGNVARDLNLVNAGMLRRLLSENGVRVLTNHKVIEFRSSGLVAQSPDGQEVAIEADTAIVAFGSVADNALAREIRSMYPEVHVIGDCNSPGKVGDAVRAGFMAGWQI